MSLDELAKSFIRNNMYMTIATCDGFYPWAASVVYVVDQHFSFYFMSSLDATHSRHILINPRCALTIMDTHSPGGVQIEGKASLVPEKEYTKICSQFYERKYQGAKEPVQDYLNPEHLLSTNKRIFKVDPVKCYIWDKEWWNCNRMDRRVEINLRAG